MKILVGSYDSNIYEVKIDLEEEKFVSKEIIKDVKKASYLIPYNDLSYIFMKDDLQYIKIGNQEVLLNEGACHLSYDNKNKSIYTSFYGAGLLKVLNKKDDLWKVTSEIKFKDNSHIHYADYIETIDLVGVCDLGDNKIFLYENLDGDLNLKTFYEFKENKGPRHFAKHKTLPIIYVINELMPSISVFEYKDNKLNLIEEHQLIDGAGSAIRITNDNKYLYGAVRFSNYIFSFSINEDGTLNLIQKVQTYGDHPRDFNLINNDKHLVVANMNSDTLVLYKILDGKLYLKDKDFKLKKGASIMSKS